MITDNLDETMLDATPKEDLFVPNWDDMKPVGKEFPNSGWDK